MRCHGAATGCRVSAEIALAAVHVTQAAPAAYASPHACLRGPCLFCQLPIVPCHGDHHPPNNLGIRAQRAPTELLGSADLAPSSGLSVRSTGVKACEGEAVVNNRKNKVVCHMPRARQPVGRVLSSLVGGPWRICIWLAGSRPMNSTPCCPN